VKKYTGEKEGFIEGKKEKQSQNVGKNKFIK